MNSWYFLHKSKVSGPVKAQEIRRRLKSKALGPLDLIYKEGDEKWKPVVEYSEFQKILEKISSVDPRDLWVILVKKSEDKGSGFTQVGPFSTSEIQSRIRSGEIKYTHFAWKEGMKEWYRLSSLEEFNVSRRSELDSEFVEEMPTPPEDEPTDNVIGRVVKIRREVAEFIDKIPSEALLEEDASPAKSQQTSKRKIKKKTSSSEESATRENKKLAVTQWLKENWVIHLVAFSLFTVLGVMILVFWPEETLKEDGPPAVKIIEKSAKPKPAAEFKVAKPGKVKVKSVKLKKRQTAPKLRSKPDPKVAPTYVRVKSFTRGGKLGVKVLTDASEHFVFDITISAEPGQSLFGRGYLEDFRRKVKNKLEIYLDSLKLEAGAYRVRVKLEGKSDSLNLSYGRETKAYKRELAMKKKRLSFAAQGEQVSFFSSAKKIEVLAKELLQESGKKSPRKAVLANWHRKHMRAMRGGLAVISRKAASKFIFPAKWLELREQWQILAEIAKELPRATGKDKKDLKLRLRKAAEAVRDLKAMEKGMSLFT